MSASMYYLRRVWDIVSGRRSPIEVIKEYTATITDEVYIVINPEECDIERGLGH